MIKHNLKFEVLIFSTKQNIFICVCKLLYFKLFRMENQFQFIQVVQNEFVATLTINRPQQLNALNKDTIAELSSALNIIQHNSNIRVVIITGSGDKAFVAGADIKEFSGSSGGSVTKSEPGGVPTLNDLAHLIEQSSKPIVAVLTGACLGGGMELALAAQYRVADDTLKYGLPEVKIGLIPGAGGTQRLPRLCGVRHALDVIVRGRINGSAKEGLKFGLLDDRSLQRACTKYNNCFTH